MSEAPNNDFPQQSPHPQPPEEFTFADRVKKKDLATQLKQPVIIAAFLLTCCVIGLIAYLEQGRFYIELQPPEVSYELLRNDGLTEGVPIAIKINQVSVFKISDPMAGGEGATRAKELVANLQAAIDALEEEPGRTITIDLESSELPAIIQTKVDGSERQVLVQITPDDIILSAQTDPKWVSRVWAERITDSLKVYMFGEAPNFTLGSDFGEALTTMYVNAQGEGGVSLGSLTDAYDGLSEVQQLALADFPPPPPDPTATAAASNP